MLCSIARPSTHVFITRRNRLEPSRFAAMPHRRTRLRL